MKPALGSIENVGHASLGLDDGTYISWWPNESVSPDSGFASPGFVTNSFDDDVAAERGPPSLKQEIAGLHEDVIRSWWVRVSKKGFAIPYTMDNNPKDQNFSLWRTNCSNIVALALRLGGGDRIVPIPRFDMYTPFHIYAWAKAAFAVQSVRARFR